MEQVILVNDKDEVLGYMEKMEAHEKGVLHRAFSVFVFNTQGELMIHRRALEKYHSGGLWTNTCCSHPRMGETALQAAHRRLQEEMGFDCILEHKFSFIYKALLDQNLTEHEYDHVFVGVSNSLPTPNPQEVCDWKYISIPQLKEEVKTHPENFTVWFRIVLEQFDKLAVN